MKYVPRNIIRDSREQDGWTFRKDDIFAGTITHKLDTGDYSIEGFENVITVERKGSTSEWAGNVTQKRFINELERLAEFRYKIIVFEFTLEDLLAFPFNVGCLRNKSHLLKLRGPFLLRRTIEFQLKYGVVPIFGGIKAKEYTRSLFKRFLESHGFD